MGNYASIDAKWQKGAGGQKEDFAIKKYCL